MEKEPIQPLRILQLEDEPTDAELNEAELRNAGLCFVSRRIDTHTAFIKALDEFKPDIVLSDYRLPAFDGETAIKIVRQHYPSIPVVMVTGAMGDDRAVELLKLGARDYVLKDRLARLAPAVKRALSEERGIRARKTAEKALQQSEAELRALVEHSPVAMIVDAGVETDEKVVMMNQKFTDLFGYTMEDVPDLRHWWPLAYPDEKYREEARKEWLMRIENAIQNHDSIEPMEAVVTCKDGSKRFVRVSLASIGSNNIITFEDLTERKQMEDALKESAERYQAIMQTANDAIICMRPDGIIHLWNRKAEEIFGYTEREAIGHEMHALITPEQHREKVSKGLQEFAKTGNGPLVGKTLNMTALRKHGAVFPAELSVSAMNIRGEWHATGIIRDITDRKQAEERIRKLTQLYATLSHTNTAIVHATNREELFARICEIVVKHGKFIMAWVGIIEEAAHRVQPVCHYGAEHGYLANICISIDDIPEGQGPTGTSIRENRVCYASDFTEDKKMTPWREAALKRGYRSSASLPLRLKGRPIGALCMYSNEPDFLDVEQLGLLEEMSQDISFALESFEREAARQEAETARKVALKKLQKALESSIQVAATITEKRDPYTAGHQQRVSELAVAIAKEMNLSAEQIEGIRFGSLIHDIGKIAIPAEILSKPSRLTPMEMELIRIHPQVGYETIKDIEFPWPIAQMILQHHERVDGSGYPAGLKDGDIILEARIIAVADTIEAMSSHRPYRPGYGMDKALAEISGASGKYLDKQVVDACLRLIQEKKFAFN